MVDEFLTPLIIDSLCTSGSEIAGGVLRQFVHPPINRYLHLSIVSEIIDVGELNEPPIEAKILHIAFDEVPRRALRATIISGAAHNTIHLVIDALLAVRT